MIELNYLYQFDAANDAANATFGLARMLLSIITLRPFGFLLGWNAATEDSEEACVPLILHLPQCVGCSAADRLTPLHIDQTRQCLHFSVHQDFACEFRAANTPAVQTPISAQASTEIETVQ